MGNCLGSTQQQPHPKPLGDSAAKARAQQWAKTGIISLRQSGLKELPPAVASLAHTARVLDASSNKIPALPPFIGSFRALQRLVLSENLLSALPAAICSLTSLKVLILDHNRLAELPAELGNLSRVERLQLAHNSLTALPDSIGSMRALMVLDVSHCKLSSLSGSLGGASSLEDIDASDNYLQSLPEELSKLKRLKTVTVSQNRIAAIPPVILLECTALQTLLLHSNPITVEALHATEGFGEFEKRRVSKYNKSIAAGMHVSLDEGIDRH